MKHFLKNLVLGTYISGLLLAHLAMTFIFLLDPGYFLLLEGSLRCELRHNRSSGLFITLLKDSGNSFERRCHSDSPAILFSFISQL